MDIQQMAPQLLQEFRPQRLLPSLVTGLVVGVITVTVATAFATLIFAGDLVGYVHAGVGLMLFGSIIIGGLTALTTSFPGLVAGLQDSAAAVLALVSAAIVKGMPAAAAGQETFLTVVAAIALASFLTGGAFLLLGQFKLGGLIRYIPYPVVGGFLAGSGLLLVQGAISVMSGVPVSFSQLSALVQPDLLAKWLPGLVFAVLLLTMLRRYGHFLIVPGMLLAAVVVFYALLWLTDTSISTATDQGWLLGSLPQGGGGLWQPLSPSDLQQVNWSVLSGQIVSLVAIAVVSVISILLNATGIELATAQELDLNRELKAAGISNLFAGLGGSMVGFHVLSESVLAYKIGARSRLLGLFLVVVCGIVLLAGGSLLSFFPNPILGGLLLFLGLDFLVEWVYDAWFKFPKADYLIVILILVVINTIGFLEGVGLGVVLAVILFVVNYSRVSVVRHTLSGANYRSNVDRPRLYQRLLRQKGHWLYILELQGFVFFGTASKLLDQVRQRINDPDLPALRFIVLDFRLVSGLDSSAVLGFAKMKHLAQQQNIILILIHLSPEMRRQMEREVLGDGTVLVFPDLDHGVEWCEEQMIQIFESAGLAAKPKTLKQQLEEVLPGPSRITNLLEYLDQEEERHPEKVRSKSSRVASLLEYLKQDQVRLEDARSEPTGAASLMKYLERKDVKEGYYLIRQGDTPQGLYFIETGQVTAQLEYRDGKVARLRTMGAGAVVGELGLYLGVRASASVAANQPSTLYYLSADSLERMEETNPEIAAAFHKFIAQLLSERLSSATDTLHALLR